jgi:hypothetical protein
MRYVSSSSMQSVVLNLLGIWMRIIGWSWIMDQWFGNLCLLPCFNLVVSFCALVPCYHFPGIRAATERPSQGWHSILHYCRLIHTFDNVEEIFNPLALALGASLKSSNCHLTLDPSI